MTGPTGSAGADGLDGLDGGKGVTGTSYDAAQTINAQTGTTYTLVLGDAGELVTLSNTGAITLTVPANASVAYPVGTRIDIAQINTGQVTAVGSTGVTVNATPSLNLRAQYSGGTLVKTGTDTWDLFGDLSGGGIGPAGPTGATGPTGGASYVNVTADLASHPNSTISNTTGLLFTAATGSLYHFKFGIVYQSALTTTGISIGMTFPAVTMFSASVMAPVSTAADGTANIFYGWITTSGDSVIGTGTPATTTNFTAFVEGAIIASTGGTVQVQHGSEVTGSAVTVKQGSWGIIDLIA